VHFFYIIEAATELVQVGVFIDTDQKGMVLGHNGEILEVMASKMPASLQVKNVHILNQMEKKDFF